MRSLSLFLGLVVASITPSLAAVAPRSAPLHKYDGTVNEGSYIVGLLPGIDPTVVLTLLKIVPGANAQVTHQWNTGHFNAFSGKFDNTALNFLLTAFGVDYIAEDGIMSAFAPPTPQTNAPWGLARISTRNTLRNQGPSALTYTYNFLPNPGNGVDIYVVDTGVLVNHPDFGSPSRARWGGAFCQGCNERDGMGHGTHVAGIAGGLTYGVAKNANIIAVKVLGDDGSGSVSDIIDGLVYVYKQHRQSGRPSIATMSLGGSLSLPLDLAVAFLIENGIHCTVAAGNSNEDAGITSPADVPTAITVGASDITDRRASYSNYGPIVDIFAPGSDITSAWNDGGYKTISGTSMATPHIAGLVAYYLSTVDPKMSPADMATLLRRKATTGVLGDIPRGTQNLLAFNDWSDNKN